MRAITKYQWDPYLLLCARQLLVGRAVVATKEEEGAALGRLRGRQHHLNCYAG